MSWKLLVISVATVAVAGARADQPRQAPVTPLFTASELQFAGPGTLANAIVSPEGSRLAYALQHDNRVVVVLDGEPGAPADQLYRWGFSPDGQTFFSIVRRGWDWHASLNGRTSEAYQEVDGEPRLDPEGTRLAFHAKKDNQWGWAVLDEEGEVFHAGPDEVRTPAMLSSDFLHTLQIEQRQGPDGRPTAVVVRDGEALPDSAGVVDMRLAPRGSAFACVGSDDSGWFVVAKGQRFGPYVRNPQTVLWSEDGERYAFAADGHRDPADRNAPTSVLVVDGRVYGPFGSVALHEAAFSSDGQRFACPVEPERNAPPRLFLDGELTAWERPRGIRFSADGKRWAAQAAPGQGVTLVVDGNQHGPYERVEEFRFSPDGARFAAVVRLHGKVGVIADGERYGPYEQTLACGPEGRMLRFAADGRAYFVARDPQNPRAPALYVDGKRHSHTAFPNPERVFLADHVLEWNPGGELAIDGVAVAVGNQLKPILAGLDLDAWFRRTSEPQYSLYLVRTNRSEPARLYRGTLHVLEPVRLLHAADPAGDFTRTFAPSPEGDAVAFAVARTDGARVSLRNLTEGTQRTWNGGWRAITSISCGPDGRIGVGGDRGQREYAVCVLQNGADGLEQVWEVPQGAYGPVRFATGSKLVAFVAQPESVPHVELRDLADPTRRGVAPDAQFGDFDPTGSRLVTALDSTAEPAHITVWNVETGEPEHVWKLDRRVVFKDLVAHAGGREATLRVDGERTAVLTVDLSSGRVVAERWINSFHPGQFVIDRNGVVLAQTYGRGAALGAVDAGVPLVPLDAGLDVAALAFAGSGHLMACSSDGALRVWDPASYRAFVQSRSGRERSPGETFYHLSANPERRKGQNLWQPPAARAAVRRPAREMNGVPPRTLEEAQARAREATESAFAQAIEMMEQQLEQMRARAAAETDDGKRKMLEAQITMIEVQLEQMRDQLEEEAP